MTTLILNGESRTATSSPDTPLLYVLRDEFGLNAAKFGCGLGQCGACTVVVDGRAVFSCVTPVMLAANRRVTTLEGLGTADAPGLLQRAFIDEQAAQCGFCIPGMMMRAQALLDRDPGVSDAAIRRELEPHLCRCGTHMRILRAIRRAADALRAKTASAQGRVR
jgi:nicotinate dehydrogenase subunit A